MNAYEINEHDQVIPYTSGRKCNDTRAWRDATELELEQRDEIERLEQELQILGCRYNQLLNAAHWAVISMWNADFLQCQEEGDDEYDAIKSLANVLGLDDSESPED